MTGSRSDGAISGRPRAAKPANNQGILLAGADRQPGGRPLLGWIAFSVTLAVFVVALPAVFFFWVLDLVTSIRAAMAASRGEEYEFPWSLQLFS